jgi:hypothetical protein
MQDLAQNEYICRDAFLSSSQVHGLQRRLIRSLVVRNQVPVATNTVTWFVLRHRANLRVTQPSI